jgi:hypothetical protein
LEHLPEAQKSNYHYRQIISSPQFIQAINQLSDALNSENYQMLLMSFGLNIADASGAKDGIEGFIKCILKKFPERKNEDNKDESKDENKKMYIEK